MGKNNKGKKGNGGEGGGGNGDGNRGGSTNGGNRNSNNQTDNHNNHNNNGNGKSNRHGNGDGNGDRNNKKGNGNSNGNNGNNNARPQNPKGKPPHECRICNRTGHWESDCRQKDSNARPDRCRICGKGKHWEDECRSRNGSNGGQAGGNNNQERGKAGECRAPNGEDISHFFPNNKFPNRECKTCNVSGHWNGACEKPGFHPVSNPNPGQKQNGKGNAPQGGNGRDQDQGQGQGGYTGQNSYNSMYDDDSEIYDAPPTPSFSPSAYQPQPSFRPLPSFPTPQFSSPNPSWQTPPPTNRTPLPTSFSRTTRPPPCDPFDPSHPDSPLYAAAHRDNICSSCFVLGHQTLDCRRWPWLLPRHDPSYAPHPHPYHPSHTRVLRTHRPSPAPFHPNTITYPQPEPYMYHQGRPWHEDHSDWEERFGAGNKDIWVGVGNDDKEGRRYVKRDAPGGCGGAETGGVCSFDEGGDVVMRDILDWERGRSAGKGYARFGVCGN
ncbi:hypothetical protein CJF31_00002374 [Rutstroemia sp. NJR-2017a BVV2]|nr:hypothetical protein CJF31_00002374 [Rutstroemia sp. NJR-2017a BVV2]